MRLQQSALLLFPALRTTLQRPYVFLESLLDLSVPLLTFAQVKFAAGLNIPFLAANGGHGAIKTVGRMESGIEIWMNQLQTVEIAEDGKTATIGGGALSTNVTQALWAAGKQTGE